MIKNSELFNLDNCRFKDLLEKKIYPQEVLPVIHSYILELGSKLGDEYNQIKDNVWVHKSTKLSKSVEIIGPAIIMENTELRHNAFIRENVIIGPGCVIGNSCEIKNSILLSNAQVPHFNYVGDSILGDGAHLGAGVILSNLRLDKRNIYIEHEDTGLRKIGSFIGDNTQIGCNSVLCPGTIVYPGVMINPLTTVKGIITGDMKSIEVERL